MTKQNDSLFLLEVLIDKIVFSKSPCFSDKDFKTCVNIGCTGIEPLDICDDESGSCIAKSSGPFIKSFNSGKSCLFSLTEDEIANAMTKYPIHVSVYKSLPCGCLPTKITMGECTIDMTKEFVEARKTFLEDPNNVSYQALKDSFKIVGPDGSETGDILMFLRISCFGKLIITRFQGPGGAPNLGAGNKTSEVVDRSCTPKKDFQSSQDPCACGAARGVSISERSNKTSTCNAGVANSVCAQGKDPYNSMPCEDPDDPCVCSGPKPMPKQQMVCRNIDQYCLHLPKVSSSYQKLTNSQSKKEPLVLIQKSSRKYNDLLSATKDIFEDFSFTNLSSVSPKQSSNSILIKIPTNIESPLNKFQYSRKSSISGYGIFGKNEMLIYMTLPNDINKRHSLGTQATASINKCLQVYDKWNKPSLSTNSDYCSTCTMSTTQNMYNKHFLSSKFHNPEVYFFGKKKDNNQKGMGSKASNTSLKHKNQSTSTGTKSDEKRHSSKASIQSNSGSKVKKSSNNVSNPKSNLNPSKVSKGASNVTAATKTVTIKDNKELKPCPATAATKGDMMVTISHIKIGPKETCPVHGSEPCSGPKCILASSGEEQGPVKVTTANNPRRGVFEIVIRKLTGAPLARNELMLEWTPPPCKPTSCGTPYPISCIAPSYCRYSKCKLIVCRASPPCKPRCSKKVPCVRTSCKSFSCKRCCKKSCRDPCGACNPCYPLPCGQPCQSPCDPPCARPQCTLPCKSSPCIRLCPVGRKRIRKSRSQPRIKSHRKKVSPCFNRLKACPVVRSRSVPGPCSRCCNSPPVCLPRKCYSVSPCKPLKPSYSFCCT